MGCARAAIGRGVEILKIVIYSYSAQDISIARAALSNMVGGMGYFYGASRVQSKYTREPVPYWRAALHTAVPSRLEGYLLYIDEVYRIAIFA